MTRSDLLRLVFLLVVGLIILARWRWPGLRLRKFHWKWFRGKKRP